MEFIMHIDNIVYNNLNKKDKKEIDKRFKEIRREINKLKIRVFKKLSKFSKHPLEVCESEDYYYNHECNNDRYESNYYRRL